MSSTIVHSSQCRLFAHSSTRQCQLPPLGGIESGACACRGSSVHSQGFPSLCQPVDPRGAVPGRLPLPPMGGGRGSWQLGPAGRLQAEVMLVSWTDSLLQGRRADRVQRQMEPRPALIYPKVLLLQGLWKGPPIPQCDLVTAFFLFSCVSSENEESSVTTS